MEKQTALGDIAPQDKLLLPDFQQSLIPIADVQTQQHVPANTQSVDKQPTCGSVGAQTAIDQEFARNLKLEAPATE